MAAAEVATAAAAGVVDTAAVAGAADTVAAGTADMADGVTAAGMVTVTMAAACISGSAGRGTGGAPRTTATTVIPLITTRRRTIPRRRTTTARRPMTRTSNRPEVQHPRRRNRSITAPIAGITRRCRRARAAGCAFFPARLRQAEYRESIATTAVPDPDGRFSLGRNSYEPIGTGFRAPRLTRASQHLSNVGAALVGRIALEALGRWIETDDCVRRPVGEPHAVSRINPDRVRLRVARKLPLAPRFCRGIVAADLTCVPVADPDVPLRVRPHAARALVGRGRLDDGRLPGFDVDARNVASGKRCVIDVT